MYHKVYEYQHLEEYIIELLINKLERPTVTPINSYLKNNEKNINTCTML